MDVHDPATRSKNMRAIGSRDTKPEKLIRTGLTQRRVGYMLHGRYRKNSKDTLPGKPDIVLTKHRFVIFINSCFWHGHILHGHNCHLFKWPKTRTEFWRDKISRTMERDIEKNALLRKAGWKIIVIWECALKGKASLDLDKVISKVIKSIESNRQCVISGKDS